MAGGSMTQCVEVRSLHDGTPATAAWTRRWFFETNEWLQAPWLQNDYRYAVSQPADRPAAATALKIVDDPEEYDAHNIRDLFALVPPIFPEQSGTETARCQAGPAPSDDRWFPNALVMFPGYISSVLTSSDVAVERTRQQEQLLSWLVLWARKEGLRAVSLPYVDASDHALAAALSQAGFLPMPVTTRSQLKITPGGFADGYLGSLPRHRARELRREMRVLRDRGVHTTCDSLVANELDELVDLRCGLIQKYGHRVDREKEETRLAWLASLTGVHVFTSRVAGDLLGFTLFLEQGSSWIAYMTGTRPGDNAKLVYFDTMFYSPLQWIYGAATTIETIDFGIGHNTAKRARGCIDHPLQGWIFPVDNQLEEWLTKTAGASQ